MLRKEMILGLLLSVFLFAGCAGAPSEPCTVHCNASGESNLRTLSVTGEGKVNIAPDIVVMVLSVITRDASINAAWDGNNAKAEAAVAAVRGQGVAEEDIRSNFSLYPQEKYDQFGQPTGEITYVVTHTLTVVVRDLNTVGVVLGAAQAAGINSVGGISFSVEDPAPAVSQARALAVENARARAEEIAEGLGVKLGKVLTVNDYGGSVPAPMMEKAYAVGIGGGGGSSVPVQAGTLEVSMTVGVVFEIE